MGHLLERFDLQEEAAKIENDSARFDIPNEDDYADKGAEVLLEVAVEEVANSSDNIRNEEVFDIYRVLLKNAATTPGSVMGKLLDSISSGLKAELDATIRDVEAGDQEGYMSHKLPLELYAFLLNWFSSAADKVKVSNDDVPAPKAKRGRGGKAAAGRVASRTTANKRNDNWSWESQIPDILALISLLLMKVQTQRIWTTSSERDVFVHCITRPAYNVTLNDQYMKKDEVKKGVFKVFCHAVKLHNQGLNLHVHIIQALDLYEHLPESMAECLYHLANEFDHVQTADEVLREISTKVFTSDSTNKGPRSYARFLVRYTELCPRSTQKQLALLMNLQDSDAYPVRQAIIEILGLLITELQQGLDADQDKQKTQKEIAGMFEQIIDRLLDTSSYVRTKVLAVLSKICDLKTPFPRFRIKMAARATVALQDKAATVRRAAISLLIKLLGTHPWVIRGGLLSKEPFEEDYAKACKELEAFDKLVGNIDMPVDDTQEAEGSQSQGPKKHKKSKSKKQRDTDEMEVDEENEGNETDGEGEDTEVDEEIAVDEEDEPGSSRRLQPRRSQINLQALEKETTAVANISQEQYAMKKMERKYFKECLQFIYHIEKAMEIVERLLGSKSKPEVSESIEFFKVADEYEFSGAKVGLKKMLHLIWTKDNSTTIAEDGKEVKGVRQKLLECYKNLYFEPVVDLEPKQQVSRIAKNLVERTYEATLADLTSLEEMMRIMMEEDYIHPDIISKLWQIYTSTMHLPKEQRRGAIIILGMLGVAKPQEVLGDRIEVMLKVGLGKLGKVDLTLARYTCVALQRLNGSAKKVKGSLENKTIRMPMDNPIFRKLMSTIIHPCRSKDWFGLAEQVINTVYALGDHPDVFCNELIKKLTMRAFSRPSNGATNTASGNTEEKDPDAMDEDQPVEQPQDPEASGGDPSTISMQGSSQGTSQESSSSASLGDAFELSQLLFVVGHVAIKHIVFLELIEREWKRQKDARQAAEKKATNDGNPAQNGKDKDGDELDQVAGNAEDDIGDQVGHVREKELLYGEESLLAVYGPMIVHICGSPHKFKNPTLRAAATLAFSKFLCVSAQFCDQHHRLLFKILETSKDANIRSNIVIALGDVAVAFSTVIDENSADLYKGLSDKNMTVKKNTLMVLTHLILNGMIKVKGQLGEMAKCVEDEDERISDLARLFFSELSGKDNAIYNNLPDVISHLSSGVHAVDEEKFESTMRYIFSFIEKDKQAETITEKLCQRFLASDDARQWCDIAFCLSLLPFKSEKSVKKLIDGLQFYRDKLHEKKVYDRFQEILAKARQNKSKDKPDSELDEFEKILEEHRLQGEEDQALQSRVNKKKKRAAPTKKGRKKAAPVTEDED